CCAMSAPGSSCHDILDDIPRDVGQPEVAATVTVRELRVLDSHQIKDGCVYVADVDRFLDSLETEVVGCSVYRASLDRATRKPHREAEGTRIAARLAPGLLAGA